MKKPALFAIMLLFNCSVLYSQVSVTRNGNLPDGSAMLDVQSTTMGMLIPRMTTEQRASIETPAEGLLVYDTDMGGFCYYHAGSWASLSSAVEGGWSLTGNTGTDPSVNFIGTTDNTAFKIRVNNQQAGWIDPTLFANTGFGYRSLTGITTGLFNAATGYEALFSNTMGNGNTANGYQALYSNITGNFNSATGVGSLYSNTTGNGNTASGHAALNSNTEGGGNTAIGDGALFSNTTGNGSTAIGGFALYSNTIGNGNTANGSAALYSNTEGVNNTANGNSALYSNTTGNFNTAFGNPALYSNTEGNGNTAIGSAALQNNTTGNQNTAIGREVLTFNTEGHSNTAVGYGTLYYNTIGSVNTAIGSEALTSNTEGNQNIAIGNSALFLNATGSNNTALGNYAGYYLVGGNDNLFLGSLSGPSSNQSIDKSLWIGNTAENEPAIFGDLTDGSIGIGTTNPDPTAKLEVNSDNQGFLPPRLTVLQQRMIENPADGLIVFNIDSLDLFVYTGSFWVSIVRCDDRDTIIPWACGDSIMIHHLVAGGVAPVDKTVTYGTVTNIPGETSKCWITSNLGADHQATAIDDNTEASAGWYWQFNRKQGYKHDGITRTPDTDWISSISEDFSWIAANDPCALELGHGWRLPNYYEWFNVDASDGWTNWNGPWNSDLKLQSAGYLNADEGSLIAHGSYGYYWSIGQSSTEQGITLHFDNEAYCEMNGFTKAAGISIRCIRD